MGVSLTKAAQWTSNGKLESTPMNESLLKNIQRFVEQFSFDHPQEAEHVFEEPLQWSTTLVASDFKPGYDISDSTVQSHEKDNEGQPLLQLSPPFVYVRSFSQLSKLLHLAEERKLEEVRACLEENTDPMVKILGLNFATNVDVEGALPEVLCLKDEGKEEDSAMDSNIKIKLFMLLQNKDKQVLSQLLEEISEKVRLDATAVKNEVELLKQFCKEGEKRVLKSLRYTSDFEFSNGCRAPPWRQAHGEICYVVIEPCDTETLYITCSTAGVFLNGGMTHEGEESSYERVSDVYEDLVTLLKSRSPRFAENINKQVFVVGEPSSTQKVQHVELVDGEEQGQSSYEQQEKNVPKEAKKQRHRPNKAEGKKKYETIWTNLAVLHIYGAEEKKPSTGSGEDKKRLEPEAKSKMKAELPGLSSPGRLSFQKIAEEKRPTKGSGEEKKRLDSGAKSKTKPELPGPSSSGRLSFQKMKTSAEAMHVEPFSESSSESEEEEEQPERRPESDTDLPSEYWQIQKLVKYLKGGDQTASVLTLCAMMDLNLMQETCQLAIRDSGGLEILLNLLDTDDVKCKTGSLKILRKISHNMQMRQTIVDMRGLQSMVKILDSSVKELKALAAETIANVAKFRRARRAVRQYGGIKKLVKLLDFTPKSDNLSTDLEKDMEVARCGALALWSCSRSTKNKEAIRKAGGIPLLGRLLKSPHENMLIPVVGTLQECASKENCRVIIHTEGMVKDFVKNLSSDSDELQMHCASAIFKCAEDKQTRDLVRKFKGLQPLVSLLGKADNKDLLAAATGAIWKCSNSPENVAIFQKHKALETLLRLLTDQPEEVLVNVVGAVGEFAQIPVNKATVRTCGGIKPLVNLLTGTNQALLVNVTKAVGACATDKDNMVIIKQLDGVCLVWSLLKNPCADVQSSAAWALCPFLENAKDAGELARSLVGGLEVIVNLLKSTNNEVLTSICAAITKIAKDKDSLAILTDLEVVPLLAKLTNTTDERLRRHLAEAICQCCVWGKNRKSFRVAGAVVPLTRYLKSEDGLVLNSTVMALYELSKDPHNCIIIHEKGAVQMLIHMIRSDNEEVQEAAARCVRNIRLLAQANKDAKRLIT
ncbi:outer dynein arm-docking complex subunit 2 isoform X2 [Melanotaenia boesemani]|uniref:outer dynein arm-docking complex subunit 2 isoform X2 n=1 Tax=Melanotaenia boesemani TaxID=1250792 RepID=UPI001C03BE73|nr:outer dynein arm-docking complex subunit 2 isoform X2 [Melanotaenia boesemani]